MRQDIDTIAGAAKRGCSETEGMHKHRRHSTDLYARTVNHVFDMFTCSGSYVTRPLVGKKRMLTDMRDVRL